MICDLSVDTESEFLGSADVKDQGLVAKPGSIQWLIKNPMANFNFVRMKKVGTLHTRKTDVCNQALESGNV